MMYGGYYEITVTIFSNDTIKEQRLYKLNPEENVILMIDIFIKLNDAVEDGEVELAKDFENDYTVIEVEYDGINNHYKLKSDNFINTWLLCKFAAEDINYEIKNTHITKEEMC